MTTAFRHDLALDAPFYVAGHRGLVGSAVWRHLEQRGHTRLIGAVQRGARPARPGGGRRVLRGRAPDVRRPGRRQGRWHRRQRDLPGRLPQREPAHPGQRARRRAARRRHPPALPRLELHLPQVRRPADPRGQPADRPAGAHQRRLRHRQDRRRAAGAGPAPPVRRVLHLGDADQPLRSRRQLRPRDVARPAGDDPQVRTRPRTPGRRRSSCGAPARRGASSSTSTTSRAPASRCSSATTSRTRSTSASARTSPSASSPSWSRPSSATTARWSSTPAGPTGRRGSCWTSHGSSRSAGRPRSRCATGSRAPTPGTASTAPADPARLPSSQRLRARWPMAQK